MIADTGMWDLPMLLDSAIFATNCKRTISVCVVAILMLFAQRSSAQQTQFLWALSKQPVTWIAKGFTAPASTLRELPQHGVQLQYQYIHDLSKAPVGAPEAEDWFGRYSWDISALVDGQKLGAWTGASALVRVKQHLQEFGKPFAGVSQGYSNIDADSHTMLYEVWAQQLLFKQKLRIKAGRIDANADFDVVATAADFLNSSMGYSPTIMEFPSYPAPKPGGDISMAFGRASQVIAGGFRTANGTIALAEAAHSWTLGKGENGGRASIGMWNVREPVTRFDGSLASRTQGYYGVLEQSVWQRTISEANAEKQNLATFVQVGSGNGAENPYLWHLGVGSVLGAPWRRRPADAIGVAASWVRFSGAPGAGFDARSELVAEAYYKLSVTHAASIVWDTQYFRHPGGVRANADSVVFTPRLVVSF